MLNARSINNKTSILWDYFVEQDIKLVYVMEIWIWEGKTVNLNLLPLLGFSVLYQSWEFGQGVCVAKNPRIFALLGASHTKNHLH